MSKKLWMVLKLCREVLARKEVSLPQNCLDLNMTQRVMKRLKRWPSKYLLCKHKVLSSILGTHVKSKKLDVYL